MTSSPVPGTWAETTSCRQGDAKRLHLTKVRSLVNVFSVHDGGGDPLPGTGFIDHIGIGVPDLVAAKEYYDELMAVLGLREWFPTGPGGPLNYGPDGELGSQVFFYQAAEPGTYSRHQTGLHHLGFLVASRAVVREAHEWARGREAVILDEPQEFPQYGEHCFATYWLDPHGFKLEAVCHTAEES
jgi:catechol 2,3-dioxygenase-like lactoylglutathione lyase family enzyme